VHKLKDAEAFLLDETERLSSELQEQQQLTNALQQQSTQVSSKQAINLEDIE
jgi:hypothetical protein